MQSASQKLCNRIRDYFFKCMLRARVNKLNEPGVQRKDEEDVQKQAAKYVKSRPKGSKKGKKQKAKPMDDYEPVIESHREMDLKNYNLRLTIKK